MVRSYEVVLVDTPQADIGQESPAVERVRRFIVDHGGEVTGQEYWGNRRLAYPIQRAQVGSYSLTRFTLDPSYTKELESAIRLSEGVLRHLLVKVDKA